MTTKQLIRLTDSRGYSLYNKKILEICKNSPCMYLGQWDTGKNMAMTHEMLLLGGSNIKKVTRVIIDEIPLSSFNEKVEVPEIEITQSVIELERQYLKAPYFYIYKTLHAMTEGLKIAGQSKVLNGSDFLKRFEFDFSRLAPPGKDFDFILSVNPSDIWESKDSYRDWETDRKSTRLNSSHRSLARMPSSA